MTSPTLISDGSVGWTTRSEPLWMLGSIEPPVTIKDPRPKTRIATKPRQRERSTEKAARERRFPICFVIFVVLLSFCLFLREGRRGDPSQWTAPAREECYLAEPASCVAV